MASTSTQSQDTFKTVTHISEIYNCTPEALESIHMPRYQELVGRFEKMYGTKPTLIARAPGRVNLIGEHIDYSGYGVLPMALEQDSLIAFVLTKESELEINHVMPTLYPPKKLPVDPYQKIQEEDKSYINYFLAGYKAGLANSGLTEFTGLKILISGNLPQQAGLSSSASFVVCSGIMALAANGIYEKTDKKAFIENCIKYERMIGTACGGMDQTISVLGVKGSALFIEFNPIHTTKVTLPDGYCFVVANSLSLVPKLLTLGTRYNKRAVECRLAAFLLLKELQIAHKTEITTLKQLQDFLGHSFEDMVALVEQHIKKEPFSLQELETTFSGNVAKILADIPYSDVVLNSNHEFFLHQRAVHVFNEAYRVIQFRDVCNGAGENEEKAKKLGTLMTESHVSCRDLFDCSSHELEILTQICLKLGALGSRLTGAGWGGCCVSLVKESESEQFIQEVMKQYFMNKENKLAITDDLNMYVFSSYPASGAAALDPQYEVWY